LANKAYNKAGQKAPAEGRNGLVRKDILLKNFCKSKNRTIFAQQKSFFLSIHPFFLAFL